MTPLTLKRRVFRKLNTSSYSCFCGPAWRAKNGTCLNLWQRFVPKVEKTLIVSGVKVNKTDLITRQWHINLWFTDKKHWMTISQLCVRVLHMFFCIFFACVCLDDHSMCVCESDSPRVSYSSTKVSFPFLLHTSPLCYFRAMLAELLVSRGSHKTHTQSNMRNPLGVFWRSARSIFYMAPVRWSWQNYPGFLSKWKNIVLHKTVRGPDHVNATVALAHNGTHTHTFPHTHTKIGSYRHQHTHNDVLIVSCRQRRSGIEKLELRQSADSGNKPVREKVCICVWKREEDIVLCGGLSTCARVCTKPECPDHHSAHFEIFYPPLWGQDKICLLARQQNQKKRSCSCQNSIEKKTEVKRRSLL